MGKGETPVPTLLDQIFDAVVVVADGTILYANRTVTELFGYENAELVGTDPSVLVTSSGEKRIRGRLTWDLESSPIEFEAIRKDGTTFPLEVLSRRIDFNGQPALLSQLRDLTRQKMRETALRQAEEKYRALVEQSLAGVTIIQHGRFRYTNKKFAEILGYTEQEVLGLNSLDVVHEDDRAMVQERSRQRLEGITETTHYTARVRRKDGRIIHVEVNGSVMDYLGERATMGTVLDVTERRRAFQQLRASEKRFRALFEESPIGIVMASTDARIQRVNAAFCEMLGYSQEELIGRSVVDISHPNDPAGTEDSAARVIADAVTGFRVNKRYIGKNGALVQAETTVSMVHSDDGEPLYAVAMVRDVTEQRQLEEQLREVLRLESVGQLAGGVAHNFNNALTVISGYSELLANRFEAGDPALRDLEQIQCVAGQSAELTQQLLAFSRAKHLRPEVFCLNDPIESACALLGPLLGDELQIDLRLDRNLPKVSSDLSQIEQAITNLVLNARDAMPDGGVLTIETGTIDVGPVTLRTNPEAKLGRYVSLTVSDTGTGMNEETVTRVFEPFFTTKEPGQGVGLGLALVHGIVKRSGGFVRVDSEPLNGSTFLIYLPEADTPQQRPTTSNGRLG